MPENWVSMCPKPSSRSRSSLRGGDRQAREDRPHRRASTRELRSRDPSSTDRASDSRAQTSAFVGRTAHRPASNANRGEEPPEESRAAAGALHELGPAVVGRLACLRLGGRVTVGHGAGGLLCGWRIGRELGTPALMRREHAQVEDLVGVGCVQALADLREEARSDATRFVGAPGSAPSTGSGVDVTEPDVSSAKPAPRAG